MKLTPQGHITCEGWTTTCSHGAPLKAGRSSVSNRPIPRRRVWPACTACCYGNSPTCGVRLCSTTRCTTPAAWASAGSSATSPASSGTRTSAGSTAWEPRGDRRTPRSPVNTRTHLFLYFREDAFHIMPSLALTWPLKPSLNPPKSSLLPWGPNFLSPQWHKCPSVNVHSG